MIINRRTIRNAAYREVRIIPLNVLRIQYASPGLLELLGAPKMIAEVRKFIFESIDHFAKRGQAKADTEAKLLANEKSKSDQAFLEDSRIKDEHRKALRQEAELVNASLNNQLLAEEIHSKQLENARLEVNILEDTFRMLSTPGMSEEDRERALTWLEGRKGTIEALQSSGKLVGITVGQPGLTDGSEVAS